jgi:hypothetical protein
MVRIPFALSACLAALGAALQGDDERNLGAGAGQAATIEDQQDDSQAAVDGGALEEATQNLLRLRMQELEAAQKLDEADGALADAKGSGDAKEIGGDFMKTFELHRSHSSAADGDNDGWGRGFLRTVGDEDEETSDVLDNFEVSDFMGTDDFLDGAGKPNKQRLKSARRKKIEDLTASLDEVVPRLEADFKVKTKLLRVALAKFKDKQKEMYDAKMQATQAMKDLRTEAERRRKVAWSRRATKERERQAKAEAARTAKEAMIKKAQALMGVKGGTADGTLGVFSLGIMVDVLMALPAACDNPIFNKRLAKSKDIMMQSTQDFINITRRKTSKFLVAASKASDVELSFLLARYFHEASFRVKAMSSDAQKVARDLNVVMPRGLRQSFLPIVKGMRENAVPLRVNGTALAGATLDSACDEISGIMANVSDYNNKLNSLHTSMHNIWQLSELMLPKVDKIYPLKPIVIDTVKEFMSMATNQIAGLSEAAEEIVTNVGPVISERMQCTWNAALPRSRLGWAALLAALASYLIA